MLKPVLVVLTLAQGGGTHLALTSAEDTQECLAKADVVAQVLEGAGLQVIEARCGETALNFTPYGHSDKSGSHIHPWRVILTETDVTIEPLAPGETCDPAPDAMPAVHCALSAQTLEADG
ncbi:hypothetical protein [Paracoccus alkenifer]|uniref:Uncharacterized protein n=1 Tax=Paracoccus alkenifer TaxID=65735 RepID=A0A1H6NPX7_9RHOB|nr:hypothetical protein [Paracoccus alkenifer]SEI12905.1 hypothetical protein SAMN04488075_0029 [Paracoccus alkenifer]